MKAWQNSNCINQWFHRFVIFVQFPEGVLEKCAICHKVKYFRPENNLEYIAYHNRQVLPREHNKFEREYAQK